MIFGLILELFLLGCVIIVILNLGHYAATKAGFDPLFISNWLSKRKDKECKEQKEVGVKKARPKL